MIQKIFLGLSLCVGIISLGSQAAYSKTVDIQKITFSPKFVPGIYIKQTPPAPIIEEPKLNIYIWADYIPAEILKDFERQTGIRLNVDVYDGNEILEAKLLTGHSGYDVVIPTDSYLQRQIKAGAYEKLDHALLPNCTTLDPDIMKRLSEGDPNNQYAVPYVWGMNGIGYNIGCLDRLKLLHKAKTGALLFDPETIAKISPYGVSLLDTPAEVFPAVLAYLGKDPNSFEKIDIQEAAEALAKIRPYVTHFSSIRFINDLANGESCVAQGWSGDIRLARDQAEAVGNGVKIGFSIPEEGAEMWCDVLAIPRHAPHRQNAHKFINYLLDPKVISVISEKIGYANANLKAKEYMPQSLLEDPLLYPSAEQLKKVYTIKDGPLELERLRTRWWTRVKTNK